jgi:hypothetical protein
MNANNVQAQIAAAYKAEKYAWFTKPHDLNVFGVRSANRDQTADRFDDLIGCAWNDGTGLQVRTWAATTDPGLTHLVAPQFDEAKRNGTAILKAGQYRRSHALGFHGTGAWRHEALVQIGPVAIHRDADRDAKLNTKAATTSGLYGINIHAASLWRRLDKIGAYSAGCQVFQDHRHLAELIALVRRQQSAGLGAAITYTLFDEADFS